MQQASELKWMTDEEMNRLIYALDTEKNELKAARDRAIVYSMFRAGLRIEEVSDLKLPHIDLRRETVTVMDGKGGKFRVIPMHPELKKALKGVGYNSGTLARNHSTKRASTFLLRNDPAR